MLQVVATLPNNLFNYLGSFSKSQAGLRIAGNIVEGNSNILALKRRSEQEVTSGV